jgi:hypothetical protein
VDQSDLIVSLHIVDTPTWPIQCGRYSCRPRGQPARTGIDSTPNSGTANGAATLLPENSGAVLLILFLINCRQKSLQKNLTRLNWTNTLMFWGKKDIKKNKLGDGGGEGRVPHSSNWNGSLLGGL